MICLSVCFSLSCIYSAGYEAELTKPQARIMRLVTYAGVCHETGESEYSATEATRLITTPGLSGGEKHQFVRVLSSGYYVL